MSQLSYTVLGDKIVIGLSYINANYVIYSTLTRSIIYCIILH